MIIFPPPTLEGRSSSLPGEGKPKKGFFEVSRDRRESDRRDRCSTTARGPSKKRKKKKAASTRI